MYIATQLLITTLATTPATDGVRDLCDVVDRLTGTPTICRPHPEGAPTYDANVCCSGSTCFAAPGGKCRDRQSLYYCGLGETAATGEVACFFEVPEYCDLHPCKSMIAPPPHRGTVCCSEGICWAYQVGTNGCELGDIYWCSSGVSNPDGTITCLDDEGD